MVESRFREEFLTCSICLDEYRTPRQLPCLHVYCEECLDDILERSHPPNYRGKRRLQCPMCKKEHMLPKDGVSGFPHDFRIQSMLEHASGSSPATARAAPKKRDLAAEHAALKFGEMCSIHNSKMELFCEEVQCRVPVCSTCYIERHLGHKAALISNKVLDAKAYLENELEHSQQLLDKLHQYADLMRKSVTQIDSAYENVFQRINAKEKQLCDKVKEVCGALRSEAGKEYSAEIKKFNQEVTTVNDQARKLEVSHTACIDLLKHGNEADLVLKSNQILNVFYSARDVTENPLTSWRSPELLNLKDDITDEVIGDIISPLVGSLCTIDIRITVPQKEAGPLQAATTGGAKREGWETIANPSQSSAQGTGDLSENDSSSEGDFVKVKAAEEIEGSEGTKSPKKDDPRCVKARMVAKWSPKSSVTGLSVTSAGNVVLCHYFDHSVSVCDPADGTVKWRSRDKQLPGLIKALGVMMGTGQPVDALSVHIQGDEYLAVSYPHQSAIKMFKNRGESWPGEVSWELDQVGFHNKQVKPAEMACTEKELMFLHWLMPLARSGEVHVLSMETLPLQHIRTVDTGFTVMTDICVLPMLRSDPLIICSIPKG